MSHNSIGKYGSLEEAQAWGKSLQIEAGVDPSECMAIVQLCDDEIDDKGFAPYPVFLDKIAKGQFPTAPKGYYARDHDEAFHFWHIFAAHPEVAEAYRVCAAVGLGKLEAGEPRTAADIAGFLDNSLVSYQPAIFDVLSGPHGPMYFGEPLSYLTPIEQARLTELNKLHHLKMLAAITVDSQVAGTS